MFALFLNNFRSRLHRTRPERAEQVCQKRNADPLQLMFFHSLQVFGYSQCLMQLVGFGRSSYTQTNAKLTMFIRPFGTFFCKRSPLGIFSTFEFFQREMCAPTTSGGCFGFYNLETVIVDMSMISDSFKSYKIHMLQTELKQRTL